ncbi:MAG: nitronate monooxygenase, partial [Proteobacteria bacterium]|nr:nitronate monooxygenase [Pseudomonadota bacterium]
VSEAGGLGILGAATWKPDGFREQIRLARQLTGRPFEANIVVSSPLSEMQIEVVIEENLPAVTTSAGGAGRYTSRLKEAGVFVIHVVPTVGFAIQARSAGVDAIVAEGSESGGFTSLEEISTFALVPQVVDAVDCPVLAAGGIGDGRGLAAAMALGAVGVQIGTRFLATIEAEIPDDYKKALLMARDTDTILHGSKKAAAGLMKDELRERVSEAMKAEAPEESENPGDWDTHLKKQPETMAWAAGQVAGLIREIAPVREVIEGMVRQAGHIFESQSRSFGG